MLKYVCCSSAYVNKHDDQGYTKLHHAVMTGNFAKCKHLVRLGASVIWASEEHPDQFFRCVTEIYIGEQKS